MPQPDDDETKTTIILPAKLRCWLRHFMADHDVTPKDLVVDVLTERAKQHTYDADTETHEKLSAKND